MSKYFLRVCTACVSLCACVWILCTVISPVKAKPVVFHTGTQRYMSHRQPLIQNTGIRAIGKERREEARRGKHRTGQRSESEDRSLLLVRRNEGCCRTASSALVVRGPTPFEWWRAGRFHSRLETGAAHHSVLPKYTPLTTCPPPSHMELCESQEDKYKSSNDLHLSFPFPYRSFLFQIHIV